jgi:hypothetical protein
MGNVGKGNSNSLLKKIDPLKQLNCLKYNFDSKTWNNVDFIPFIIEGSISFITYNVWFENHNMTNRYLELFKLINSYQPDFICIQENTHNFMAQLLKQELIQKNYYVSSNYPNGYDVSILSKHPVEFYSIDFESNMGRKLLLTEVDYKTKQGNIQKCLIGTSHFESLSNSNYREKQLNLSFEILNNSSSAFLMGDFNFDSSWKNEEKNIDLNFNDCWFIHQKSNKLEDADGWTMAGCKNFPPWRPDRILFKDSLGNFNLEKFEIIGKDPIEIDENQDLGRNIFTPSDHYGLYSKLSF